MSRFELLECRASRCPARCMVVGCDSPPTAQLFDADGSARCFWGETACTKHARSLLSGRRIRRVWLSARVLPALDGEA